MSRNEDRLILEFVYQEKVGQNLTAERDTVNFTVELSESLHKKLALKAARESKTRKQIFLECLEDFLKDYPED